MRTFGHLYNELFIYGLLYPTKLKEKGAEKNLFPIQQTRSLNLPPEFSTHKKHRKQSIPAILWTQKPLTKNAKSVPYTVYIGGWLRP